MSEAALGRFDAIPRTDHGHGVIVPETMEAEVPQLSALRGVFVRAHRWGWVVQLPGEG